MFASKSDYSDASLLIDVSRGFTLIELIRFEEEVKAAIGDDVKVVTLGSLRPDVKPNILEGAVCIYPNPDS